MQYRDNNVLVLIEFGFVIGGNRREFNIVDGDVDFRRCNAGSQFDPFENRDFEYGFDAAIDAMRFVDIAFVD